MNAAALNAPLTFLLVQNDGNDLAIALSAAAVPEAGAWLLVGVVGVGACVVGRVRRG